jgi:hypothetical protein
MAEVIGMHTAIAVLGASLSMPSVYMFPQLFSLRLITNITLPSSHGRLISLGTILNSREHYRSLEFVIASLKDDNLEVAYDVLSRLPPELQIQVANALHFSGHGHVRASSRALATAYVDPTARLVQEVVDDWAAVERAPAHKYIITFDMKAGFLRW